MSIIQIEKETQMARKPKVVKQETNEVIKLDIGCGKNKQPGFIGIDQFAIDGVDVVCNVREGLPYSDNSVEEIYCSHFIEHLTALERVRFMNELYRVMKPGAKVTLIAPHWCSNRAYGDMTHCWPPVSEMWFYYLSKTWREDQVPHTDKKYNPDGYDCDFNATWGYSLHPVIQARNLEFQQDAIQFKKEAAQDIIATLVKI